MARYGISPEGAESMRALAKQLYTEANSILESSSTLENKISSVGEGLGIYEAEIISIIQRGRNTLKNNRDDIINLAHLVLEKANEIDAFITLDATDHVGNLQGTSTNKPTHSSPRCPQYASIDDIPQKEFECISKYNTDSNSFNEVVRSGKSTKDTELLSKMIGDRELSESKVLYRRASINDLNGLSVDMGNLNALEGQQFRYCGFMSTTPNSKLPNYVSRGNVFFEFSAPAGSNALDLSAMMYNEIIFDSPLCQIDHVEQRGNDIYIVASIV